MNIQELPLFQHLTAHESKLLRQWNACKLRNPWLLPKLAEMSLELKRLNYTRYSINGIFEALRWETRYSTGDLGLKVNNNHRAFAARDLMTQYPQLDGFFQLREQKPHGNFGQIH